MKPPGPPNGSIAETFT